MFLVVWVDTGKTLREQGIDESETVLLKRKFFFSDQNIDSRDPVQLNLLYVQARDAILDGTHPVTQDKGKQVKPNRNSKDQSANVPLLSFSFFDIHSQLVNLPVSKHKFSLAITLKANTKLVSSSE